MNFRGFVKEMRVMIQRFRKSWEIDAANSIGSGDRLHYEERKSWRMTREAVSWKTDERSRLFRVVVLCADSNHPGESDEALEVKRSRRSQVEEADWDVKRNGLFDLEHFFEECKDGERERIHSWSNMRERAHGQSITSGQFEIDRLGRIPNFATRNIIENSPIWTKNGSNLYFPVVRLRSPVYYFPD